MSRPLPVFTIQTFNQNALQPAGAVFAQRVEAISVRGNIFGGLTGGRITMMEKKINELTQTLIQELDLQAKKMYPNAVALINFHLDFSDIKGNSDQNIILLGQASATALIKRVKPVGQSMIPTNSSAVMSSSPVAPVVPAPVVPAAMPSPSSPAASAAMALSPQNAKDILIPKAISGGKRKSFISKSRKNRK
jgi:uncharacterized protein YbjQ (UPF0145 family)